MRTTYSSGNSESDKLITENNELRSIALQVTKENARLAENNRRLLECNAHYEKENAHLTDEVTKANYKLANKVIIVLSQSS